MIRPILKPMILLVITFFLVPGLTLASDRSESASKKQFGSLERGKKSFNGQTEHYYDRHRYRSGHRDRDHRYHDRHRGRRDHDRRHHYGRHDRHRHRHHHHHYYHHHYYHDRRHHHHDRHHHGRFIFDPGFFFSFGFHDRW